VKELVSVPELDPFGPQGPGPSSPWKHTGGQVPIKRGGRQVVLRTNMGGDAPFMMALALTRRDWPEGDEDARAPTADPCLVCELTYGAGQANETVRLDWLNGMTLAVPSGSVDVTCVYPEDPGGEFEPSTDLRQMVGAVAAYSPRQGGAGSCSLARLTTRLRLGAGQSEDVLVPNRAHALTVLTTDPDAAGSFLISMRADTDPDTPGRVLAVVRATGSEDPLPGGTRMVRVTSELADEEAVRLALIWSIAL
jgi:hypothetical protein